MGRSFDIHVEVTEGGVSHAVTCFKDLGTYKITISKSELERYGIDQFIVAMHELGHVLCAEFDAPANNRYIDYQRFSFVPPPHDTIMEAEHEAWDVAEMLIRLQRTKRFALSVYEGKYEQYKTPVWYKP